MISTLAFVRRIPLIDAHFGLPIRASVNLQIGPLLRLHAEDTLLWTLGTLCQHKPTRRLGHMEADSVGGELPGPRQHFPPASHLPVRHLHPLRS